MGSTTSYDLLALIDRVWQVIRKREQNAELEDTHHINDRDCWIDDHIDPGGSRGCVAYYPTQIPFHHRSAWMGDTDPLGDLIKGCREQEMAVIVKPNASALMTPKVTSNALK